MVQSKTSDVTVTPITQSILGMKAENGLLQQIVPPISTIAESTFRAGSLSNRPQFSLVPRKTARLGIFSAENKGSGIRAVILLLPVSENPQRVTIGISHQFSQSREHYEGLGWTNPLSPALVHFVLLKHVLNRWGAEILTAHEPTALLHIVRAGDGPHELGSFANDGNFVHEVLQQLAALTDNAFTFPSVHAFTFSNGIFDFNTFLSAIANTLNVTKVINIDPRFAIAAKRPRPSTVLRQYLTGETYQPRGPRPGFEYMPLERWENESLFLKVNRNNRFQFLHNHVMPLYALSIAHRT